jgi:uncharacterized protein (TIGR02265 family)
MNTPERLIFSASVEALLLRGVAGKITPRLDQQLRELGIDLSRPLLPAYPSATWQKAVDLVAQEVHPGVPMGEAQKLLGASTVYGWEQTLVGKAMFAITKLYGPRRLLLRFPVMSRSSNNFSSMQAKELGPNQVELTCYPYEGHPSYVVGCIQAVATVAGAREPKVEVTQHDTQGERITLQVSWTS